MRPPKKYRRKIRRVLRIKNLMALTVFVEMVGKNWRWRMFPSGRWAARQATIERELGLTERLP